MKGDFTRTTFQPGKHYSRVLQQQGRVQLDADWNEALDILTYRERQALIDVIGRCCAPEGNAGYEITSENESVRIGAGRYYVDGILVENDAARDFTDQIDLPNAVLPGDQGRYLFYLDVWERHVTALEDADLREVALGGPDTATRTQVLGQVKVLQVDDGINCDNLPEGWEPAASTGTLAARAQPADDDVDPCIIPPEAGYRRLENQLYRVEIYAGGSLGDATFTCSRENATVVSELLEIDGSTLVVAAEGRDENLSFHPSNWVEINDDDRVLGGQRGILVQLTDVEGRELTVDWGTAISPPDGQLVAPLNDINQLGRVPWIRRWETEGAVAVDSDPAVNDGYILLESGVQVKFGPGEYRTGDYWLIPARTNIGDVLWPVDPATNEPVVELPHGIIHHYCALALATFTPSAAAAGGTWSEIDDCRRTFTPLCALPEVVNGEAGGDCCCCGISVGDGDISDGDFNTIQEAVEAIRNSDRPGTICLLPGTHRLDAAVNIEGMDITITGCGWYSVIRISSSEPAFRINNSRVRLQNLVIEAISANPAAVHVQGCVDDTGRFDEIVIENCEISNRRDSGAAGDFAAIYFNGCRNVILQSCRLVGTPAVVSASRNVQLLDNQARGGGFWLERGSADVVIAGNDIRNGRLQGITLGGARINPANGDEFSARRITIHDNHIRGMEQSAIGSAIRRQEIEALGRIDTVIISQNRLVDNLTSGLDQIFDGQALGGIVLHGVRRAQIHDNQITGNGRREIEACGICISWSSGVEIKDNHILENGRFIDPGGISDSSTFQGGIFLLPVLALSLGSDNDPLLRPGGPAFQVHDNVVVTPAGQSLVAYGYGPMSIRGNAFTSRGVIIQPPLEGDPTGDFGNQLFEAANVSVFNLAKNARGETEGLPAGGGIVFERDALLGSLSDLVADAEDSRDAPAGQLAYHGNQSDQTGLLENGQFASPATTLVSFGDAAAQDNQSMCRSERRPQLTDWRVLAETTRVQDNWVDEAPEQTLFSIVAFGRLFCHTSHNQAAECIYAEAGRDNQIIANQVLANQAASLTDNDIIRVCRERTDNNNDFLPV